jgi:hypothetical protein
MLPDKYCGANSEIVFCAGKQQSDWCYSSLPWVISVCYWSCYFIYLFCLYEGSAGEKYFSVLHWVLGFCLPLSTTKFIIFVLPKLLASLFTESNFLIQCHQEILFVLIRLFLIAAGRLFVAHSSSNVKTLEFVVGALHIALFASLKGHAEFY